MHHQGQVNTSPLQFGSEKSTEGVWSRLRTHIKKKCFKENRLKQKWPLQLMMSRTKDIQGNVLKKMEGRLTKLEEAKLIKTTNAEIHDDEEGEGRDERVKADYERKKQFEKLIVETVAMKEKMEKMQLAYHKAQGMDDCLYSMRSISSKTLIALSPKFKISNEEKFDGTRDPNQHVRRYLSIAEMKGLDEKQTLHAFPLSLIGGASR